MDNFHGKCFAEAARRLQIYNGYDASSPVLFDGCGMSVPAPSVATSNVIFVKLAMGSSAQVEPFQFNSHSDYLSNFRNQFEGSRFKLSWQEVPMSEAILRNSSSAGVGEAAGATQRLMIYGNASTIITNPGYPGYQDDLDVAWILQSPPATRIKIRIY